MQVEIKISGLDEVGRFAEVATRWASGGMLDVFGEAIIEDARLRLEDDETDPDGNRWAEWSDSYAATRGPGDKILFDSGDLSRSLSARRRGSMLSVASSEEYAAVHQFGSLDGNTPAREFIGVGREFLDALGEVLPADLDREFSRGK